MRKHLGSGAEGFCASVKDEVYGDTHWRGKDKKEKDMPKIKRGRVSKK